MGLVASDLKINLLGGGLVVLGLALLVATLAFWRSASEDPEVLAPLEVMADRKFSRANDSRRAVLLNKVRPQGAEQIPPVQLSESQPVTVAIAETADEPNPRIVRRLRGSTPVEPSSNAPIDPLLNPRRNQE